MRSYEEHFSKVLEFLNTHTKLVNCHLVDFIVQDLWIECLPNGMTFELQGIADVEDVSSWIKNSNYPKLNAFVNLTRSLSLNSSFTIGALQEFSKTLFDINREEKRIQNASNNKKTEFMNSKKSYEVEVLGNIVSIAAKALNALVIDAGAGKAYLSTHLASTHNIPVLAIDSSNICHEGALNRQKKMGKKKQSNDLVSYALEEIKDDTDYPKMIAQHFKDWKLNENLIITGLHTCGSLANSIIKAFLNTKDIKFLCLVPCCYHLTSETLGRNYSFSKNARMLAQQSLERTTMNQSISPLLFYRVVLQVVLHSMGLYNIRIGRGGPTDSFCVYARWALLKIGVKPEEVPNADTLENIYCSYADQRNKFNMFQLLRIHVAPVLEAAIILDRVIFLQEQKQCSKAAVLRLFDPILSPRRFAILGIK